MYRDGKGVAQSDVEAAKWTQLAAHGGVLKSPLSESDRAAAVARAEYYEEAVKYGHLKSGSDSEESMSSEGSEDAVCQSALELKIKTAETEASEKREKRPKIE